nr:scopoletin glucosyltransferase-like [Ipomoea trifida]
MGELHVFFFPLMAQGHMIPTLDMAKLFASRGVKATIITTPANQPVFSKPADKYTQLGFQIQIRLLEFPAVEVGLPEDCQSVDKIPSVEARPRFFKACAMLQEPLEQILRETRPDCLVADMFFPWATNAAAKFDIPRLIFHGTSQLSLCAVHSLRIHKPFKNVSSDSELFTIPNLPHGLKLTRSQVSPFERNEFESPMTEIMSRVRESEETSYGVIFNSFYELEPDYAEHYKNVLGIRAWSVGPLSLYNRDVEDKAERGKKSAIDEHECLEWLDSKNPHSVVYICFGSVANFAPSQLHELALGIEDSGMDFVLELELGRKSGRTEEGQLRNFMAISMGEGELHVFFFPFMDQGHMIPILDMAKLFASRGVKATIITTPLNQPVFSKAVEKYAQLGFQIQIRLLQFPGVEVGLPETCQRLGQIPSDDGLPRFFQACEMLQEPLEQILRELRPDCLVADIFFPWATEAAAKFDIPRLIFHGCSYLGMCATNSLETHKPFNDVSSDSQLFTIPNLPHELKLTRLQVSPFERSEVETPFTEILKRISESEETSYGEIFNSFYELEPDYAEQHKNVLGRRAWSVGPLSLYNRDVEDKAQRGNKSSIDELKCLEWLDSKNPHSVVYICFGSVANFAPSQLQELALGIEDSGLDFIWTGIGVGSKEWKISDNDGVKKEAIAEAIKKLYIIITLNRTQERKGDKESREKFHGDSMGEGELHVIFFPFMAQGHMIPILDMAKLLASRGVKATIISTPLNQPVFSKAVEKYAQLGFQIQIRLLEFPGVEVGLPESCQRSDQIPSDDALTN